MRIELDPDVNSLYIAFRDGAVARTLEVAELVFADMDEHDVPLGLEFVNADDFIPFMRERAGGGEIPPRLRALLGAPA